MFILFFSYFSFDFRFHLQIILSIRMQAKARKLSQSQSYFFTGKVIDGLLVMRKIEVCYA